MKPIISLIGILLIIFGIISLGYNGITYTKREKLVQLGDLQVTADAEKKINIPPLAGGLALVGGLILVVIGRMK